MAVIVSPYDLRSRNAQPKDPINKDPINHFDMTETTEEEDQAKEFAAFQQATQVARSRRKVSCIVSINKPVPQAADSGNLSSRPKLQDFSHVVIPLSDIRSQVLNPEAIPDNDAYWNILNIPAFSQDRAKLGESILDSTTQPAKKQKITENLAATNSTHAQSHRRAHTPAFAESSTPPSPSGSELSSVDESILADTPEAFADTASTISTSIPSTPSPVPRARPLFPARPARLRQPRGPRRGVFVEPANAKPPLFDYCAAACQLREHNIQIKLEAACSPTRSEREYTTVEPLVEVPQALAHATGQANEHEDENEATSDGDPIDVDEQDATRQPMPALTMTHAPLLRRNPTWHQLWQSSHREHSEKRKRAPEAEKDASIEDILQMEVKKARKGSRPEAPAVRAPALTEDGRKNAWRKGLMDSIVEAEALKGRK